MIMPIRATFSAYLLLCFFAAPLALGQAEQPKVVQEGTLPFAVPEDPAKLPRYALLITTKGPIELKLFPEKTPVSVANFEYLGRTGFYEGKLFHRFIPDFIVQGGDPLGNGKGDPGWNLPPEMRADIHHVEGTIGWARQQGARNPQRLSNGSQFYICLSQQPRLDGFYTAFGVVVRGMDNVRRLRPGDKILKVRFPVEGVKSGW